MLSEIWGHLIKKPEEDKKPRPVFDLGMCLFCGQCEEVCPKDAISLTKKFEFSTFDKSSLIVE
jgi:formate hydrogenlyase subunit 6/NADH:ubiquinone oxidoreductase subunit I